MTSIINEIDKSKLQTRLNKIENIEENCIWKPLYNYNIKILADDIKYLRKKTGTGLITCKHALIKTNGNIQEALKYIK